MTWSNRHRFPSRDHETVIPQSHHANSRLLTEGILDANIDSTEPGFLRVALWREWETMLADVRDIGPVWSIVRNGNCVLAVEDTYPVLTFSPDKHAAQARQGNTTLTCHFRAWRRAAAFESSCCCGKLYGLEIASDHGEVIHRVCLAQESAFATFVEWTQMHQATGLEDEPGTALPVDHGRFHPQSYPRRPGTLEVPLDRLRTALLHAAQREIPLIAGVTSEGATQTTRLDIQRASEARGWLVLSGHGRSLYLDAAPTGSLLVEPAGHEGQPDWRLSLIDPNHHRLLHLRAAADDRPAWTQLIREFVLSKSAYGS